MLKTKKRMCFVLTFLSLLIMLGSVGDKAFATETPQINPTEEVSRRVCSTSSVHYINNETDSSDYKLVDYTALSTKILETYFTDKIEYNESALFEVSNSMQDVSTIDDNDLLGVAKSYLIKKNILSRAESLSWKNTRFEINKLENVTGSSFADTSVSRKSDLLMALYKTKYGTIESRPVVLNLPSVRNALANSLVTCDYWTDGSVVSSVNDYWGPGTVADFSKGDYYVYVSPNVYESYFKELLDIGMLNKSDFSSSGEGSAFIQEYESFSNSRPEWFSGNGLAKSADTLSLGHSFNVATSNISQKEANYFGKGEQLYVLDALQLIEKFMRITEKEITETEADIITYKYGLTYLDTLTDSERKTVSFLIAKGVVSFEDNDLTLNLYGEMTNDILYNLLYRVANTDARYDFSKIQLTDSESFWQGKGFVEDSYTVETVESVPICQDADAEDSKDNSLAETTISMINDLFFLDYLQAATNKKSYEIVKNFDKVNTYSYNGKELSLLENGNASDADITKIKNTKVKVDGKDIAVYQVTFSVSNVSKEAALNYVNHNIAMKIKSINSYACTAVTKIKSDSGDDVTMVSQTTLKQAFSGITVLEDKVLLNSATGARACILADLGYALVGNTIIRSKELMITASDGEVYYNVDIIFGLLSNVFFDNIGANKVFVWNTMPELSVPVGNNVSDSSQTEAYYIRAMVKRGGLSVSDNDSDYKNKSTVYLYRADSLANGVSTLVRNFKIRETKKNRVLDVTVVVDWKYVVPSLDSFNAQSWYNASITSNNLTIDEVSAALYEEPAEGTLIRTWWDSNIGMSNALANFMYGTSNTTYVRCGYMVPSVTVLVPKGFSSDTQGDKNSDTNRLLNYLFKENGFSLDVKYSKFINGSTSYFWTTYYENQFGCTANAALQGLAKENRTFTVVSGTSTNSYGECYGTSYVRSKAGLLYRNVDTDTSRMTYKVSKSNKQLSSLTLKTRVSTTEYPATNAKITYKNQDWYYLGIDRKTGYLILSPAFDPTSNGNTCAFTTQLKSNSTKGISLKMTNDEQKEKILGIYEDYFPAFTAAVNDTHIWKSSLKERYGTVAKLEMNSAKYVLNNGVVYYKSSTKFSQLSTSGLAKAKKNRSAILCVPKIYLPAGQFYIYKSAVANKYLLGEGTLGASLNFTNFYQAGINSSVIDAVLANYIGTRKVGTLSSKMQLCVGDVIWTKSGNYWYSEPILDTELLSTAKSGGISRGLRKFYAGMEITCDGQYCKLANYFSDIKLAPPVKTSRTKKDGIVCAGEDSQAVVWKNGYKKKTAKASYVAVRMTIDDSLQVRPLNAKGSKWTISFSASSAIAGDLSFPFFSEELSYEDDSFNSLSVDASSFTPSSAFISQRDKFNTAYQKAFSGDVWDLLKMVIVSLASYLSIMSWVAFGVLTLGYGRVFLEAIRMPVAGGGSNGFDLMRIITFKLYSLDDEPSLARVFIVTLVCFIIIMTIINFL